MIRTAAHRRSSGVCRSLFGPVDHDQLNRDLKQRLREISEQDTRRWNFNFQTDTPQPGRYQWEEMPSHCSTALYRESVQVEDVIPGSEDCDTPSDYSRLHSSSEDGDTQSDYSRLHSTEETETNQENCSSISNTLKLPSEVTPVRRKRTVSKQAAKPQCNAEITDFFVKRRRTSETKDIQNSFHSGSSEPTLCKRIR